MYEYVCFRLCSNLYTMKVKHLRLCHFTGGFPLHVQAQCLWYRPLHTLYKYHHSTSGWQQQGRFKRRNVMTCAPMSASRAQTLYWFRSGFCCSMQWHLAGHTASHFNSSVSVSQINSSTRNFEREVQGQIYVRIGFRGWDAGFLLFCSRTSKGHLWLYKNLTHQYFTIKYCWKADAISFKSI